MFRALNLRRSLHQALNHHYHHHQNPINPHSYPLKIPSSNTTPQNPNLTRSFCSSSLSSSSSEAELWKYLGYFALLVGCGIATYYSFPFSKNGKHKKGRLFRYAPLPDDLHTVSNWSGTHEVQTRVFLQPETMQELETIVRDANEKKQKIRPVGSGLSSNGIGLTRQGMVNLALLDKVLEVDKEKKMVRVQAGIRVQQLVDAIKDYGLTLQNFASIREQQIGGIVQEKRQQLLTEIRTLCEAPCYQGLVEFHGAFYTPNSGQISIALEYMDGGSLADIIRVRKCIPEPVLSSMVQKLLYGLSYLHGIRHLVHRDIKPANLLINLKGEPKITDFVHIGLLWLFIFTFGWGTTGAAIAFDISRWGLVVAQVVYVFIWCKDGWSGFSWSAFKEIWAFVRLSLASAVMLCLEIWYMMSIIILTGHLDNVVIAVGSLSICMNFNGWEAMLFIGINAAISVRVSNELGLGHPRAAKYFIYVTVFQSFLIGIFCVVLVLATRDYFAIIFTSSKELQQAVAHLAYLLGFTMLLNSVQPVISGVAVGGGWQALVAYINLGCYYIFGLPLGYLLGYAANFGVMGLWGGMITGIALQTLLFLFVLYKTNWNKEECMGKHGPRV